MEEPGGRVGTGPSTSDKQMCKNTRLWDNSA